MCGRLVELRPVSRDNSAHIGETNCHLCLPTVGNDALVLLPYMFAAIYIETVNVAWLISLSEFILE